MNQAHLNHNAQIQPEQLAQARRWGELIARGIFDAAEGVEAMVKKCQEAGYTGDQFGLRARLAWEIRDTAEAWLMRRHHLVRVMRRMVAERMDAGADPRRELREMNEARGSMLSGWELRAILDDEARWWDIRRRKAAQSRGRYA